MEQSPGTNIYKLIRKLGIVKHKKRQEFICSLIEGIIKSRSVIFSEIADKIDSDAKTESIERRIQDFFQKVKFDYKQLGVFLLSFVHHDKVLLSIDRTEWDFGQTQINILCIAVSIGKMAIPVYFEMLDNKSGNSNSQDRIDIFKDIVEIIGKKRIKLIVMDREFIGNKWLAWLKSNEISFCVRVPKNHKILFLDGCRVSAEELLEDSEIFCATNVVVDNVSVNISLSYGNDGELLFLIGNIPINQIKEIYKRRWSIEVFFQALKTRGFNLEKSCLRCIEKYKKLFAIVSMAYTICWATGIQDGKVNPVKPKTHGYPQYSVSRRGLNLMRLFYKNKILEPIMQAIELAIMRINQFAETVG